jgi:hypothetical protein
MTKSISAYGGFGFGKSQPSKHPVCLKLLAFFNGKLKKKPKQTPS